MDLAVDCFFVFAFGAAVALAIFWLAYAGACAAINDKLLHNPGKVVIITCSNDKDADCPTGELKEGRGK